MKRVFCFFILTLLIFLSTSTSFSSDFDYARALRYSIYFFDANKCGHDVCEDNVFDWRGPCHLDDGHDVDVDLTGGFHDAGDHVKFGLPQAYTASILGWAYYKYSNVFEETGVQEKFLSTLKYFTDYMLKCHPEPDVFYYQVGDGAVDHTYWGAPEEQTGERPTLHYADLSNTASDVLGQTSAALTLMYLNYKDIDADYAQECLEAAKNLYQMGIDRPGYNEVSAYYRSSSFYDDLAWAASWLYLVEGDPQYLEDAEEFVVQPNQLGDNMLEHRWTMCWDDMYLPAMFKLYQITNKDIYKDALEYNLDYWLYSLETTPGGLKYLSNWGVLRYVSAASMLALMYYEETDDEALKEFAHSQIDYILGDNPEDMSYLIGYGERWPKHPHHRAANGYTYADGDNQKEAIHVLLGALVGGPDLEDNYIDDVNQYQYTEVAIDYNAGFVGAVAGLINALENGSEKDIILGDVNGDQTVNSLDYTLLGRYLLGEEIDIVLEAADLNQDGEINSLDIAKLGRILLGN
ncbi:glycoside hydrolase family 9 protein [Natronospora cellulosivora (SeqCode)]